MQAEDTINVLTKLNNKKIGSKNVAVRYAKHIEQDDDKSSKKGTAQGTSQVNLADKKSKIQLIEEQLKRYQNSPDDFELNKTNSQNGSPTEPLIKKYQFNKDAPRQTATTSSRHQNFHKRRRKPY